MSAHSLKARLKGAASHRFHGLLPNVLRRSHHDHSARDLHQQHGRHTSLPSPSSDAATKSIASATRSRASLDLDAPLKALCTMIRGAESEAPPSPMAVSTVSQSQYSTMDEEGDGGDGGLSLAADASLQPVQKLLRDEAR
jgi:hypothetical protein